MATLLGLLKTTRPRQWVKNLALLAPVTFAGLLFNPGYFQTISQAILIFTLLSSGVYIFNDLIDAEKDRLHPFKRKRPIASGELPKHIAVWVLILLQGSALVLAYQLGLFFFYSCLVYLLMQYGYTLSFKHVPILDLLVIASGYIIRVYAGGFAVNAHMNVWFLLTVISVSLFMAVGKRRSELTLLKAAGTATQIRQTLKHYTEPLLDIYTAMFATATWVTYALFSFNHPPVAPTGKVLTLLSVLPKTLTSEKWMMATTPLVIFGVMRYLQLVYEKNEGESPERILLSDKPLIATVLMWILLVTGLIYVVG